LTPGRPLVSIVIVTWNGLQYLDGCLGAVAALVGVSTETILVDNMSTDGSVAYVRERFPWVRVVALSENRGFAGGMGTTQEYGRRAATSSRC
jgi:GT2 family glycosyltransferase